MGGYSCQRKSRYNFKEVYGIWKLPTDCKGSWPGDYKKNIVPEMFFGFYTPSGYGFDIGLCNKSSGIWAPFSQRLATVYPSGENAWKEGKELQLSAGETLYCRAWIEKSGSKYKSYFNVSRKGYKDTDLLSAPCEWELSSDFGSLMTTGYAVNREIAIGANSDATNYETSGCYLTEGKFLQHGLVNAGGVTYIWTDENSYAFPADSKVILIGGADGRKILKLRKDNGTVDSKKISATRTDSKTGATETVSINFGA